MINHCAHVAAFYARKLGVLTYRDDEYEPTYERWADYSSMSYLPIRSRFL